MCSDRYLKIHCLQFYQTEGRVAMILQCLFCQILNLSYFYAGIKQGAVDIIKGIVSNELPVNPAGEIILRHWQYTHNKYWHIQESLCSQYRPKLPCTQDGLKEALKNIGRNDLVRLVEESHEYAETEGETGETEKS